MLLKSLQNKVIYEIEDLSEFNQNFLDNIDFKGCKRCIVFTRQTITNEWELASNPYFHKSVSIIYSIDKQDLIYNKKTKNNIFKEKILNYKDFLSFYYDTKREFYEKYKDKLGTRFWEEYSYVVSKLLFNGKHLCIVDNNNNKVALLTMIKWKDIFNKEVDWINWVWISKDVDARNKIYLRNIFKEWIKKNSSHPKIQCVVNLFNVSSQKFFNKIGFCPICINILNLLD